MSNTTLLPVYTSEYQYHPVVSVPLLIPKLGQYWVRDNLYLGGGGVVHVAPTTTGLQSEAQQHVQKSLRLL